MTPRRDDLSPQCHLLLKYLRTGRKLTNLIAIASLGVGSLSSRVAELRAAGYEINGVWKTDAFGDRKYKEYWLVTDKDHVA